MKSDIYIVSEVEVRPHVSTITNGSIAESVARVVDPNPPSGKGFCRWFWENFGRKTGPLVHLVCERNRKVVMQRKAVNFVGLLRQRHKHDCYPQIPINVCTCESEIPKLGRTLGRTSLEAPGKEFDLKSSLNNGKAVYGAMYKYPV